MENISSGISQKLPAAWLIEQDIIDLIRVFETESFLNIEIETDKFRLNNKEIQKLFTKQKKIKSLKLIAKKGELKIQISTENSYPSDWIKIHVNKDNSALADGIRLKIKKILRKRTNIFQKYKIFSRNILISPIFLLSWMFSIKFISSFYNEVEKIKDDVIPILIVSLLLALIFSMWIIFTFIDSPLNIINKNLILKNNNWFIRNKDSIIISIISILISTIIAICLM